MVSDHYCNTVRDVCNQLAIVKLLDIDSLII